ncbi:rab3 GTPase-activating protein catalytic subunit isoform X2 [Morus notabilis]|uniref:rab3 GTPase-activating protein catalytic subunit isoform X2 n=1 Tax=Morus notabilis TaxID=981085 RepID=UPI000CED2494|nr:rab3 GTPase-activating protein catalytic subunit isoform X2 [Morus notabilis]
MEAPNNSFVSKARTALHSAAAKAERVFSDFKSDRDSDKQSPKNLIQVNGAESLNNDGESKLKWRPAQIKTKQDWQERLRNITIGRKGDEETEKAENSNMFYDENLYLLNMKNDQEAKAAEAIPSVESFSAANNGLVPPLSAIRQLAIAVEAGKKSKSMKDFLASSGGSSPARERGGLSLSVVKSLVLRDKEDKLTSEFGSNDKVLSLIRSLFNADGTFLKRKIGSGSEAISVTSFPRDIHGAPPQSLIVKVAEVIGSFKNVKKMALFWCRVVAELRRLSLEEKYIPSIPLDEIPDLNSCLLYQQLQVINCCVSRKSRRDIANQSLDSVIKGTGANSEESAAPKDVIPASAILYARINTGELVLRLGADCPSGDLTMLETGEPVYSPVTQEGPLLTEDLIKETEEFVLRTGSVGAGCSQLLSDMQAFKAANPGCILEDFVRWHSPPDWTEAEPINESKDHPDDGDTLSTRGQLSTRMQKAGNLWHELWETAKPVPAVKQAPLFDEDLAVEGILAALEDIPPSELFQQLFRSLLGLGFVIAEATLPTNSDLLKLFCECKDYAAATCQSSIFSEKIDDLCQVYETVEGMLCNPEEVLRIMKQAEEATTPAGEPKRLFKRLNLNFGGKDRHFRKPLSKEHRSPEENRNGQPFSSFFDGKSSLFSKKPPKAGSMSPAEKPTLVENGWTVL